MYTNVDILHLYVAHTSASTFSEYLHEHLSANTCTNTSLRTRGADKERWLGVVASLFEIVLVGYDHAVDLGHVAEHAQ